MEEVCEYGPHVGRVSSHALSRWSRSPCCGGFISWFVLSGGISWGFFSFSLLGMHKADLLKTTHSWPIPEDINDLPSKIENDVLLRRCSLAKRPKSPRNLNRAHWTVTFRIRSFFLGNGQKRFSILKTGNNGNAMFQSYLSKIFKKETG